jgi:hypothetical protein
MVSMALMNNDWIKKFHTLTITNFRQLQHSSPIGRRHNPQYTHLREGMVKYISWNNTTSGSHSIQYAPLVPFVAVAMMAVKSAIWPNFPKKK